MTHHHEGGTMCRLPLRPAVLAASLAILLYAILAMAHAPTGGATTPTASPTPSPSPSTISPEATRNTKVGLLQTLTAAPDMLVFGSSRAMRVNPADYTTFTGRTAINLAVSSGNVGDAYCFAQYVHDLFPGSQQRYLWLLDLEQFRLQRVAKVTYAQPELAKYVPSWFPSPYSNLTPVPAPTPVTPVAPYGPVDVFEANGWLRWNRYDYWRAHSRTLTKGLAYSRWKYRQVYPAGFPTVRGVAKWFVDATIEMMNSWGVAPVIVLTPYQPSLYKYIQDRGWPQRYKAVLAFFDKLHAAGRQFVLLDCTQISSFGGWSHGFYDGTHMRSTLSKMLLLHAVANSHGAL